jgi:heterodisulfide reductase subunit A-like polyferredoxin
MTSESSNLGRRKFLIAGSAVIAAPLLLNIGNSVTEAQGAGAQAKGTAKGKVYFINRTCVGCQVCKTFCPVQAIHYGDCANEIDQKKCIHCGTCYRECPISVISETEN